MKQGRRMDMVDARSLRGSLFCDSIALGSALSVCVSFSKSGCVPFYFTTFYQKILERTLCLVHLIASDWSRTSAELQHRVYCTFGSAGIQLTHPAIYGSSDPPGAGTFGTPLSKEFHPPEKKREHINSLQSLNDAIHWSRSTIRELGHPVAPTGGEEVADACSASVKLTYSASMVDRLTDFCLKVRGEIGVSSIKVMNPPIDTRSSLFVAKSESE
ncbi:hypothetical protein TNCV_2211401 [Trichonephila clavipes]|nr:hypothetical protein TNCV_2211401 [Trichonephila clavipes]